MIRIEKYIEKLLLTHDCVIIPELGGFVTQYEPAYKVDENNAFYPPFRTIGFNEQLTMNDGLLVQAYMQTYDTNYPEALRLVKEESHKIKNALHNEGYYHFENIGKLELNSESKLLFTPENEGGIACPQLYGLDVLSFSAFKVEEQDSLVSLNVQNENLSLTEAEDNEIVEENTDDHYIIRLNRNITHYVAAAIVAICFYFTFSVPVNNHATKDMKAEITNSALYTFPFHGYEENTVEAVKVDSSTLSVETSAISDEKELASNKDTLIEQENIVENEDSGFYTIVLASCIKESNAKHFIENITSQGYNDAQFYVKGNMQRIIYSRFSSEEDAVKALRKLTDNELFKDAWILYIK